MTKTNNTAASYVKFYAAFTGRIAKTETVSMGTTGKRSYSSLRLYSSGMFAVVSTKIAIHLMLAN